MSLFQMPKSSCCVKRYLTLADSLSEYLISLFECERDEHLNFPKLDCITGTCENECNICDESDSKELRDQKMKMVSYYQFETKVEQFYNKKGELKYYTRTTRVDYNEPLGKVYELLQECARSYLEHRYHTLLDKIYWQNFLDSSIYNIIWMDFSQNIKLLEKNQVQSAHFSGKQQTLHDTLIKNTDNQHQYVYHQSDDTNHDSVMTIEVIKSVIEAHPKVIESGKLVLRSDNCAAQYKSWFIFGSLLEIADRYDIEIIFFYGEAGHGRGLIDAMAWFGCKGPLRKEIVANDSWFPDAKSMVDFLKCHFRDDLTKEYHHIDEAHTAELRKFDRLEHPLPGSSKAHVISFSSNVVQKWNTIRDYMQRNEANEPEPYYDIENALTEEDEPEYGWNESIEDMDKFNLIGLNTFIAIRAEPGSTSLFHIMKVVEKKIAENHFSDTSGEHSILKGELYLICDWYSFQKETKQFAWFSPSKGLENSCIHVGEIFSFDLVLNEKYQMDIAEYRFLICSAN